MLDLWLTSSAKWTVAVLVVTGLLVQGLRWLVAYRSSFLFFNSLPGETDFSWIWGNLHKFRNESSEVMMQYFAALTHKYPKFYRQWNGPFRAFIRLHHPDTVRTLLKTAGPKPWNYDFALPWLGEGLLIARGARWQRSRRLLTPAFHFNILKPYNTISNRACDLLLQKVEKQAAEKKSMEMFSNISLCTFDVILQCAMSYTDDIQTQGKSHPYVQAVIELTELWSLRVRNPLVHKDWIYSLTSNGRKSRKLCDFVHSVAERIIKARQDALDTTPQPVLCHGRCTSCANTDVLCAGHDTTASAVSWTLYALCQHQDIQRKVQQEVDRVLQGRDTDDIESEDLPQLEYLTMVIKEGMRVHNPVPFVGRLLTEPLTLEGVTLPAGTVCAISIHHLHHNPTVWSDPHIFNPERFHPDQAKDRDSFAFIPFSAGPRNCIGQHFALNEQKVMLARLVRRYTFSLDPSHKVEKHLAGITRTETGMMMFAVPRTPSL